MTPSGEPGMAHSADTIQTQLARYAQALTYERLPPDVVHAATALVIDTLGVLLAGYPYEPCRIARTLAERSASTEGATIIGSRLRTHVDLAAFVNATTARYAEANDVYARHLPGHMHGHPSDVILPLLAVAEQEHASGRDFLASVVLDYEVYLWLCDVARSPGFDGATFACLGVAMGAGRLLALDEAQLRHAIAMAVVPNNILRQVRADHLSPWKALASGQAGRAGVFAAELARAGMPGPNLPFEGRAGWCKHVAGESFGTDGLDLVTWRILGARMKPRPARALTIPAIQAAERVGVDDVRSVSRVRIEVHRQAADGTHAEHWHPDSRETADHSIPFGVAAALAYGRVGVHAFDDGRLRDPQLLQLMRKMDIVANDAFSAAFSGEPQRYCARVTVTLEDGTLRSAESGGDEDDLAKPKSDAWVSAKFREMTEEALGREGSDALLQRLWRLADEADVADLPPAFVIG
jgi:2-methylcitrate dehydratase